MDFLGKSNNITSEGLFRKIGSICRQKTMRKQLLDNSTIDFENVSSHDGANVLKNFLRDLPEPLLTHQFRNVQSITCTNDRLADFFFGVLAGESAKTLSSSVLSGR
jgi:hypothetical protein